MLEAPSLADRGSDPRITRHLDPGEEVLWTGRPRPYSMVKVGRVVSSLSVILAGALLATGGLERLFGVDAAGLGTQKAVAVVALVAMGLAGLLQQWHRRSARWAYAITDRRLMVTFGKKLLREVTPEKLEYVKIRHRLGRKLGDVYWERRFRGSSTTERVAGPDGTYVGFKGQENPEDVQERIQSWRRGFTEAAEAAVVEFLEGTPQADADAAVRGHPPQRAPTTRGRRLENPHLGFSIDVPAGWEPEVHQRELGPLRILGLTIPVQAIRNGPVRPYGADGEPWNVLSARGGPDARLEVHAREGALDKTWEEVANDRWATRFGFETLLQEPELSVGGLRGFSIVRRLPPGSAVLHDAEPVAGEVAGRWVWLGDDQVTLEIVAVAPMASAPLQEALDAMVGSVSRT